MKTPTAWISNPTKNVNVTEYDDATVTYDQATQCYDSPTVGENELNKPQTAWIESPSV